MLSLFFSAGILYAGDNASSHKTLIGNIQAAEENPLPETSATAKVASPEIMALWDNDAYKGKNGLTPDDEKEENPDWITKVATPQLYIYPAPNPNGIALVMCPGGGYYGLAMEHEGKRLAGILNDYGITLAVLKYRMPNSHHEIPAEDARRAIRILRDNSQKWGIDKSKVGIGGASAGGHLASTVATHFTDSLSHPDFQVLLYPVISMKDGITHEGSKQLLLGETPSQQLVELYSNETQVTPQTPPAFIVLSGDDTLVPIENSLLYYKALNDNGIPSSLHIYPKGGHG